MSTKSKEIEKTEAPVSALAAPADTIPEHMKGDAGAGTEDMGKYQSQCRITIVQSSSGSDRKEEWGGEGAVAITPDGLSVAGKGEEFIVTPLVFFPTWEIWNDYKDQGSEMVAEVSFDESSDIARRSRIKSLRSEAYGPDNEFRRKYMQCLNFMCYIHTGDAAGETAAITFRSGDHRTGQRLCGMLKRRSVPIFGNRLALKTVPRSFNNNDWFGFDINNPGDDEGAYITDEETYARMKFMHEEFAEAVEQNRITINRVGEAGGSGEGESPNPDLPPI